MHPIADELIQICRFFSAFERETVCCGGVTVAQCVVLQALLPGERDVSSLAGSSGASTSAMTRLVDGLSRRGYVERTRDPDDRRRVLVALTSDGRREAERLRALTDEAVWSVLSHIPAERRDDALEALRLIRSAIERSVEAGLACCAPPRARGPAGEDVV